MRPRALRGIADELERRRGEVLAELEGISQRQADWRPAHDQWFLGEVLHHLVISVPPNNVDRTLSRTNIGRKYGRAGRHESRGNATKFPPEFRSSHIPPRNSRVVRPSVFTVVFRTCSVISL